jgi:hypothetical protein
MSYETRRNKIRKLWNTVYQQAEKAKDLNKVSVNLLSKTSIKNLLKIPIDFKNTQGNFEIEFTDFPEWAILNCKVQTYFSCTTDLTTKVYNPYLLTYSMWTYNDKNRYTYSFWINIDPNLKFYDGFPPKEYTLHLNFYFYNKQAYNEISNK